MDPPSKKAYVEALTAMEQDLDAATEEAMEYINSCSYVWRTLCDMTHCRKWTQTAEFQAAGILHTVSVGLWEK